MIVQATISGMFLGSTLSDDGAYVRTEILTGRNGYSEVVRPSCKADDGIGQALRAYKPNTPIRLDVNVRANTGKAGAYLGLQALSIAES